MALRKELAEAGHDAGAETIAWHLREQRAGRRRSRRSGGYCPGGVSSPPSRTSGPAHRGTGSRPTCRTSCGRPTSPTGRSPTAATPRFSTSSMTTPGCSPGAPPAASSQPVDVVADLHLAMARHGRPERMLTDNGAVFTGLYRGRGWVALERELTALGIGLEPLPALPPADLRQSRAPAPDPEEMARPPRPRRHPRRAASPARHLHRLLQQPAARTAASAAAPPQRPGTAGPGPSPRGRASASASTSGFAAIASTPTASSPCATTAGSTTSASAAAGPAPRSSSSPATWTCGSSPSTTEN